VVVTRPSTLAPLLITRVTKPARGIPEIVAKSWVCTCWPEACSACNEPRSHVMYRSFLPLLCFVCLASTVACTIELDAPGAATAAGADPEVPGAPENNQPTSSKHIYASKTG